MQFFRAMILTFLALPAALAAQTDTPKTSETIDVNVVTIDATVTDRDGNAILGLEPSDFIVEEEGRQVEVESADYFTNLRLLDRNEKNAPFRVERVREERYFVFFLDKEGSETFNDFRSELLNIRQALRDFVEESMLPTDRILIAGFDTRLKLYSDFTSDKKELRRALDDAVTFSNGLTEPPPDAAGDSVLARIDTKRMRDHTGTTLEAMEVLAEALRSIRGRKVLTLFSAGIGEPSRFNPMFIDNISAEYDPALHALQTANVTVYTVNLLRHQTGPRTREEVLTRLAGDTGGSYHRNVVSFATPLKLIDRQNSGYYLLTYTMRHKPGEHGFQKVAVRTKNPEFRVTARAGYEY